MADDGRSHVTRDDLEAALAVAARKIESQLWMGAAAFVVLILTVDLVAGFLF